MKKKTVAQEMNRARAQEAAEIMCSALQEMSFDVEAFAEVILREHRTIQQSVFRAFGATILAWANSSNMDMRNEHTVLVCREMLKAFGDDAQYKMVPPYI